MNTETCDSCGNPFSTEQLTEFDGQQLCPSCFERATVICAHCGARIWRDENAGDSRTPLCERCYESHYSSCSRCGSIIHMDNAYYEDDDEDGPHCHACHTRHHRERAINDYYYKPELVFHGSGPASSAWSWRSTARASMTTALATATATRS